MDIYHLHLLLDVQIVHLYTYNILYHTYTSHCTILLHQTEYWPFCISIFCDALMPAGGDAKNKNSAGSCLTCCAYNSYHASRMDDECIYTCLCTRRIRSNERVQ